MKTKMKRNTEDASLHYWPCFQEFESLACHTEYSLGNYIRFAYVLANLQDHCIGLIDTPVLETQV